MDFRIPSRQSDRCVNVTSLVAPRPPRPLCALSLPLSIRSFRSSLLIEQSRVTDLAAPLDREGKKERKGDLTQALSSSRAQGSFCRPLTAGSSMLTSVQRTSGAVRKGCTRSV